MGKPAHQKTKTKQRGCDEGLMQWRPSRRPSRTPSPIAHRPPSTPHGDTTPPGHDAERWFPLCRNRGTNNFFSRCGRAVSDSSEAWKQSILQIYIVPSVSFPPPSLPAFSSSLPSSFLLIHLPLFAWLGIKPFPSQHHHSLSFPYEVILFFVSHSFFFVAVPHSFLTFSPTNSSHTHTHTPRQKKVPRIICIQSGTQGRPKGKKKKKKW